ncbi:hypothetical protein KJ633_01865 [bacterium]|nr:hypothetical protein [bacterium]MBU3955187.1 hypothetical protein [bacterium]MBU4134599.1 hypothetical protein [bacterium]
MFEKDTTEILLKFLEEKCAEAAREIEEKGALSNECAISLLLKTQINNFAYLEMKITGLLKSFVNLRKLFIHQLAQIG